MSGKLDKKIRHNVRKLHQRMVVAEINSLSRAPFAQRIVIAWRLLRGKQLVWIKTGA